MKKNILAMIIAVMCGVVNAAYLPLTEICDTEVESFSAKFQGHNADGVVKELKRIVTKKDDYESDSEYTERIEKALNTLPLSISSGGICVVEHNFGLSNTSYVANSKILWVNIFNRHIKIWVDGNNIHKDFRVFFSERNRRESSYIGSNAFGVSTRVSKMERSATYITFDGESTKKALLSAGFFEDDVYFSVPLEIPPVEARALHGNVRVAYKYRLRLPYLGTYEEFETPKIDWPFESKERQTLVIADLRAVIVFDKKTGRILKRINF